MNFLYLCYILLIFSNENHNETKIFSYKQEEETQKIIPK